MSEEPQAKPAGQTPPIKEVAFAPLPEAEAAAEAIKQIQPEAIRELDPHLMGLLSLGPVTDSEHFESVLKIMTHGDVAEAAAFWAAGKDFWFPQGINERAEREFIEAMRQWQTREINHLTVHYPQIETGRLSGDPEVIDAYIATVSPVRPWAEERMEVNINWQRPDMMMVATEAGPVRVRRVAGVGFEMFRWADPFFSRRDACPLGEQILKNAARSAIAMAQTPEQRQQVFAAIQALIQAELKWWNLNDFNLAVEADTYLENRRRGLPETNEEIHTRPLLLDLWILLGRDFRSPESARLILDCLTDKLHQQRELAQELLDYARMRSLTGVLRPVLQPESNPLLNPFQTLRGFNQRLLRAAGTLAAKANREEAFTQIYSLRQSRDWLEETAGLVLAQSVEMYSEPITIEDGRLHYYGQRLESAFEIVGFDPEQTYTASEVGDFLLVVRDEQGRIVGEINLYPQVLERSQKAQCLPAHEAINSSLRPDQRHPPEEIGTFLELHDQVFAPGSEIFEALHDQYLNPSSIPLNLKIEIANFLSRADRSEEKRFYQAIRQTGINGLFTLAAAEGNQERFNRLIDFCLSEDFNFAYACCHLVADVEALTWEMATSAVPSQKRSLTRVSEFAAGLSKGMRAIVADMADMMKKEDLSPEDKDVILKALLKNREAIIAMVHRARGLAYESAEIDWRTLEELEQTYHDRPGLAGALSSYYCWLAAAQEIGVSNEETAARIERAYGALKFLKVNVLKEASKFTADTERDRRETAAIITKAQKEGLRGFRLPKEPRVLDAGCELGFRVTGPLRERLGFSFLVGVDIRKSVARAWEEGRLHPAFDDFIFTDVAFLPKFLEAQEKLDLALNLWSASLDPQELTSQIKFHLGVALCLKRRGIYIVDFAPLVQVPPKIRSHWKSAMEYAQKHPELVPGAKPPPPEYRTGRETDELSDTIINSPYLLMEILGRIGFIPLTTDSKTLKNQLQAITKGDLSLLYQGLPATQCAPYLTQSGWLRCQIAFGLEKIPQEAILEGPDPLTNLIQQIMVEMKEASIPPRYRR